MKKNNSIKIIFSLFLLLIIGITGTTLIAQDIDTTKIKNKEFNENVVFYPQHQDDEILWGVSAITKAIEECGADNVYIVLVSDGSGVNVFTRNPIFTKIPRKEKEKLRNNEFKAALQELGVKDKNIIILADEDNKLGTHYELMEKTILKFEQELGSVTHIAHHYKYDDHIMHRKNGEVLKRLRDEHKIKDARYFMKPKYVKDIPEEKREYYKSETEEERDKAKKAINQYKTIDVNKGKLGIGYTSAHSYFGNLYKDPNYTSVLSVY